MEILRQETDEDHPLKTSAICKKLVAMNISCDPRTLHRDMKLLIEHGYDIISPLIQHERAYYLADNGFSVPELKIMMDAVQAAGFITPKKTAQLMNKIASLGGSNRAEVLMKNIVHFNTRKHNNEAIYYIVDVLEDAICTNKKVIFRYFDIDENRQRVYRRDGHHYVVEPVALIFNEDNYYLMCYSSRHGNTANYRVDRMDNVEIIDEELTEKAKELRDSVAGYTESVFRMYGGKPEKINLRFPKQLIGPIYDKFGENIKLRKVDDNTYSASVMAQISPTFWGWLFQFEGQMSIVGPKGVVGEYLSKVRAVGGKCRIDE